MRLSYFTTAAGEAMSKVYFGSKRNGLTVVEVLIPTLSTEDEEPTDDEIRNNCRSAGPPNEGISN